MNLLIMKKSQVNSKIGAKQSSTSFTKLEVKSNASRKVMPSRERRKIDPRKILGVSQPLSKQKPKVISTLQNDIEWETVPLIKTVYKNGSHSDENERSPNQNQSIADQVLKESIVESDLAKEVAVWNTRIKMFMAKIKDSRVCTRQMIEKIKQLREFKEEVVKEYRIIVLKKNEEQLVRRKSLASKHDLIQRNAMVQKSSLERFKQYSLGIHELEKKLAEVREKVN